MIAAPIWNGDEQRFAADAIGQLTEYHHADGAAPQSSPRSRAPTW